MKASFDVECLGLFGVKAHHNTMALWRNLADSAGLNPVAHDELPGSNPGRATINGGVMEMVDVLRLERSALRRGSSNLPSPTNKNYEK